MRHAAVIVARHRYPGAGSGGAGKELRREDDLETALSAAVVPATVSDRRAAIIARLERLPFGRFHASLAAVLAIGTFFDAFDALSIAVALTVIVTSLHIGFVNVGLLISSAYVGQFAGAWLFGYASEAWGRKPAFCAALLLFGLLSIATAFAWSFESLLVLRLVQGLGLGGEVPVAATLFNEYLRTRNRGRIGLLYQSVFIWGALLAPVVGIALFGLLGPDTGWRALFLLGGVPVLAAVYGWFALPESARWLAEHGRFAEAEKTIGRAEAGRLLPALPDQIPPQPEPGHTRFAELFSRFYLRRTIMVWVQWAATFFVAYGYNIWLPTLYVQVGGLPVSRALGLSVVQWALTIVAMYGEALLLDTIGRKPLFIFGFCAIAAGAFYGCLAILLTHSTGWRILFTASLLMGIGTSLNSSAAVNYTAELYPTRMRALGVAAGSSMNRLASVLAPTAVGALLGAQFGVQSVFALFGAVGLVGVAVLATMGIETKQRSLEDLSP